jgi:RHS repeat-associated protein
MHARRSVRTVAVDEGSWRTGITGDAGGGTQSFSYDGLSRLKGSTGLTSGSRSYTYDLDANRLTRLEAAVTTTFTYDRSDELINQVIRGTTKTFAFDPWGNQTSAADANSLLTTYAYDEAGRLTTITPPAGSAARFTFDAIDRQKTRTVGAATDTYGYLGASKTSYETGAASTDALLDAQGARLAVKTGGTVSFALFDLHGSLVGLCTAGGSTITDAYRYDGWGQTLVASGTAVNPWRYRGLLDVSPSTTAPLYAMGARLYSPGLGTFTSEDSVAGKAGDPLSMNRYLYAEADPTTLIDPDGHATVCSSTADYCLSPTGNLVYNTASDTRDSYISKVVAYIPDDAIETKYINKTHAGSNKVLGGTRVTPRYIGLAQGGPSCLPGRNMSARCADDMNPRSGYTLRDVAIHTYYEQQKWWVEHPGGGWKSFLAYYNALIIAGTVASIFDAALLTGSSAGTVGEASSGYACDIAAECFLLAEDGGWDLELSPAGELDNMFRGLAPGRSDGVAVVQSEEELQAIYDVYSGRGVEVTPEGYNGPMVQLNDGTTIGLRSVSKSGGSAIDITYPDGTRAVIHVAQP